MRLASVAGEIARGIGAQHEPDCDIGHGRITITFRRIGATRWDEAQQSEYALRAASVARMVLSSNSKKAVRERAGRAIVIVFEDATIVRGCAVVARWECVIPAAIQSARLDELSVRACEPNAGRSSTPSA